MTKGIHHITAIASSVQANVDFYTKTLGLRLVKRTVNQDDTGTYHLFYGDKLGHPGMDLTFFIFLPAMQGVRGNGQVTTVSLAVREDALEFWEKRLEDLDVKHEDMNERFGRKRMVVYDGDGQRLELVGVEDKDWDENSDVWTGSGIDKENAIASFESVVLSVNDLNLIEPILTHVLGYALEDKYGDHYLYQVKDSTRANRLEVVEDKLVSDGLNAAGTVHHIAFRAEDEEEQLEMRTRALELGLYATEVIDRFYFKSVYFRTPAGVLFEIATDGPGFTADEDESELGRGLALPPFLEARRAEIESGLNTIKL